LPALTDLHLTLCQRRARLPSPVSSQSAVQSRCLQAKIDEAQVHRHNSERMRKHVARAAEREAELRATHAEAQRAAAKREQALAQRLARSQRAAPSAEPGRTPVAGARARTAQNGGGGGGSCEDSDAAAAGGAQEGGSGGGSGASFQDLDAAIEQVRACVHACVRACVRACACCAASRSAPREADALRMLSYACVCVRACVASDVALPPPFYG
jgi:hypothetical protein